MAGIKQRVGDDREFRRIYDAYLDIFLLGWDWRVLHYAANMGHLEICKFLVQNVKVHLDILTGEGTLSLSRIYFLGFVFVFIEDPICGPGDTPMMLAVKKEHLKIVKYFIDQGARVDMQNSRERYNALHYAVLKGQ